ncbi:hypothetical protein [Glycomyces harbinensis]|uniref:Uncharacterized protein n=1 Tax=Glycomyces harbinensis TaxID=58114 RepID=A0A1G7DQ03_9ACTN|nr:hypothetical protein [Glycomyces harbinensis]SDE53250.1 hypothetical protein SAMN05216270_12710 [Glycomyces harbinensis]
MRSRRLAPLLAILAATACATACTGGAEPAPEATPTTDAAMDMEQLDQLWTDVAATRAELGLAEAQLVIECLEAEGFTVHDISSLSSTWSSASPVPSEILADLGDSTGLPDTAEAETRALGQWLSFADAYGDEDGIAINEAERAETEGEETAPAVDLSPLEPAGEGWEELPAVDQMAWEIAYRGTDWAATSKAASVLTADEWAEAGLPDGEWVAAETMTEPPQGCQGSVLTELHGEPRLSDDGITESQWIWGPTLEIDPALFAPIQVAAVPEADGFLTCLAGAGYPDWTFSESGGLDIHDLWRAQYLPEAAQATEDGGTEYSYSDITDADRERYEAVKADEFAAAAAIAECDVASGYSEAANAQYAQSLATVFGNSASAQQTYLAEIEDALANIGT